MDLKVSSTLVSSVDQQEKNLLSKTNSAETKYMTTTLYLFQVMAGCVCVYVSLFNTLT